ncbi:ribonucleoside-diphosphate reductase, adenosylcobalamin-dependent [Ethanoligenens harbinense YUAN-3]|uniref:Vitamin B12-dependent ribonucleotide reductase n=2 Tax=Ethanoligenens harbinense TaxID=253239 RepID=E6U6T3_ETHHY|nr:vitamin B12-dependent ribonucleotide reductase [Ethanoligenens harbinense]ADU25816.1 ribonucleoside-diphosphate reductase, adenosylcobalamin-dependent [Ethanoligenens harbinense YUAN-3]AVQ94979.1 ribonucleoside-diphosphate reductase, adenosylcobalamin-dependent [Ethanoligenens harbinense YUAN-3]AYF37671.1 ribonucleoside-diphosphate reductase, adenosylcobalamin-dependent [Ethanoligenens harbinense]AYF40391.1 ribonucleoside-diphosphate reductase, adenosylcobalamin-dependent [Ethanoligenens har
MDITPNARTVLEKRYLIRDADGRPTETIEELFHRVADAIAAPDRTYNPDADIKALADRFYARMTKLEFLPNSPTLMNAGRPLGQLAACFVLPVEDSMEAIFEAIKQAALIHKSGGGTGFSFSRLRPKGSTVNTTGGVASGPVSFMRVFNMATEAVKQGGTRRGANMGILRVDHPDILEFIDCKKNNADITNFNISVGITEAFMRAVEADEEYDLIDPNTKESTGRLSAREVFEKIVDAAWRNGEPGIIFLDRLNRDNMVPSVGAIESTNPCGEQPLLPYEACNLGSVNLHRMLRRQEDGASVINWDKLADVVRDAVHFLDNVIDANRYPLAQIDHMTKQTRKIGLGVMGWADLLLELGIPYNSDEAVALGEKVMGFITDTARSASAGLAQVRGAFPLFEESTLKNGTPVRNATMTTIAPTGTLSIIAGCSSGVEPVFAYVFIRNVMDGTELVEANPVLRQLLEERGLYSEDLMRQIAQEGSLAHIDALPEDIRRVFVCAHDISPEYHIKMQAAFQRRTDNAVSKTVNFAHDATIADVRRVYMLAYELGCKGVTIYRDGSRDAQVLNIGKVNAEKPAATEAAPSVSGTARAAGLQPRPRPNVTTGFTERCRIGCGNLYITVNYDENGICEVFTNTGRAGGCPSQSEATARLVSIGLRAGLDVDSIIEQLKGIRCPSTIRRPGMQATSCPDAIARVIEKVKNIQAGEPAQVSAVVVQAENEAVLHRWAPPENTPAMKYCPDCGAKMEHEGGCVICRNCGYSKCG